MTAPLITDTYGRTFSTLRISLTGVCNLGCSYCVPEKGVKNPNFVAHKPLDYNTLFKIVQNLGLLMDFKNVRLTGGEPTLYPDLVSFTKLLYDNDFKPISLTTNGYLLQPLIKPLKQAGLSSINISLDTLKEETFVKLARTKSLHRILDAIEEARNVDLALKINMVVMKGINDGEILDMLAFCGERGITLRFLELMKMGHLYSNGHFEDYFFSENEILELISSRFSFEKETRAISSTSNYWKTANGYRFGIIANESSPFCNDCDRLRLDSSGNLFGCLSKNEPIPISENYLDAIQLKEKLSLALAQKQPAKFTGSELSMIDIGG